MANFAKASITNLQSEEKLDFQFNPVQWVEQIQASYSSDSILFGTRDAVHWTGTRSMQIPLELIYVLTGSNVTRGGLPGDMAQLAQQDDSTLQDRASLADVERFLKTLMYPSKLLERFAPPDIIFEWPGVTRILARVTDLEISYEQFDIETLAPYMIRARLNLTEVSPEPIDSSQVRVFGSMRASSTQVPQSRAAQNLPEPTRRFMRESVPVDGNEGA